MNNKDIEDTLALLFFAVSHLRESMDSQLIGGPFDRELSRLHLRECERCINEIISSRKFLSEVKPFEEGKEPI